MEKHFKIREDLSMKYLGRTLYRIEATKDLPRPFVKKGDLGGWIEKEENLQDNAWVADEAKVYGNAIVSGDAIVSGGAIVSGDANVSGNANVLDNAWIYDNAKVQDNTIIYDNVVICGNAKVYGNAKIYGNAWVYGNASVYGNSKILNSARVCGNATVCNDVLQHKKDCKNITGERYNITITPKYIKIGCQHHTKEEWWNFTDREILEMDGKEGLKWWNKWKPLLKGICEDE